MATVPVPRTWVNGEFVTDVMMNATTGVRDAMKFLLDPPRVRVRRSTALAMTNATWTPVAWDQEDFDNDNIHPAASAGLVAQTAGWYDLYGSMNWATNATGIRGVRWVQNGTVFASGQAMYAAATGFETSVPAKTMRVYLNVGDIVTLEAYQSSGGSLSSSTGAALQPHADMRWMAP